MSLGTFIGSPNQYKTSMKYTQQMITVNQGPAWLTTMTVIIPIPSYLTNEMIQIPSFYDRKNWKKEVVVSAEIWTADVLPWKLMQWPLDQRAPPN